MIKRKLYSVTAGLLLSLGAVGSANAFYIQGGDFKMIVDNYDSATTAYGSGPGSVCSSVLGCDAAAAAPAPGSVGSVNSSADTMGIFSIASITRISDGTTWFTRGVDGYLTGIFGNLTDYQVDVGTVGANTFTSALAVGGTFNLFLNSVDYNPALGPVVGPGKDLNNAQYPGIDGGQLVLTGHFASGIIAGDTTTTFATSYNNATIKGESGGYLDIDGGTWKTQFDTNGQVGLNGEERDLLASFTFFPTTLSTAQGWSVISSGQITGNAIPEPGSLALLGLGGLAAGWMSRRRKTAKK